MNRSAAWARALGPSLLVALLALGALTWPAPARANRYVTYVVRERDTAESIAAEFYGNRARAPFITEFNGLSRGARLKVGQTLRIPTSYRYKLVAGETLDAVAQRLVGDRRRAPQLLELSGLRASDRAAPGTEIQVPFHFMYMAHPGDTWTTVARSYFGDAGQGRLLAAYNFRASASQGIALGERIVVPVTNLRVRAVRLPKAAPPPKRPVAAGRPPAAAAPAPVKAPPPPEPEADPLHLEAQLASQVSARLAEAERSYKEGNYTEVPAALVKLLAEVDPSEAQLVSIYRLLACSYVALGETELAVKALREVLDRQPDFQFDAVETSPKIRKALELARGS